MTIERRIVPIQKEEAPREHLQRRSVMHCQHCGLSLDPQQIAQTGRCPRCGTPVALGAPAQQPIGAGAAAQLPAGAASFAGQPAGGYPPTPVQPGYAPPAQPGGWAPPPGFTPPLPGAGFPPQQYPGGMLPPAQKKGKTGLLAAISAALVVILLGGSLLALGFAGKGPLSGLGSKASQATVSKTPAATATPKIPAGFQVFTSSDHLYSVAYPAAWQTSTDQTDKAQETFQGPANQGALTDDFTPNAGVTPTSFDTAFCAIVGGGTTTGPTQTTIGGQNWTRLECDSTDGTTHNVVESVSYKGKTYSLIFSSDKASFSQNQTQFFTVMEKSFTFLS